MLKNLRALPALIATVASLVLAHGARAQAPTPPAFPLAPMSAIETLVKMIGHASVSVARASSRHGVADAVGMMVAGAWSIAIAVRGCGGKRKSFDERRWGLSKSPDLSPPMPARGRTSPREHDAAPIPPQWLAKRVAARHAGRSTA